MEILGDFHTSVRKALEEIEPNYRNLPGLVICGSHSPGEHNIDGLLTRIKQARETNEPFLGICFGHQLAAIEYAQNVLGNKHATSEEWAEQANPENQYVVVKLPQLHVGLGNDGESYWHNYEVVDGFENIWKKPYNFFTCQFHPEYQSTKNKPHPFLVRFIELCKHSAA